MIANTIEEVIEQLDDIIKTSIHDESSLGYFAALYQNVTVTVKNKLGQNYFDDDQRMEKLDVVFANRYLESYSAYKKELTTTKSWDVTFQASKNKKLIVLQHLLLGMNAHINLDLGIAAAEITNASTISNLQSDFNKINEILSSLVEDVQQDLAKIWPTLLKILKLSNKVDNFLADFSMKLARDGAWKFANELSTIKGKTNKEQEILKRDDKISELSKLITKQGIIVRIIFAIIRWGERGKTSEKIKTLMYGNN